MNASGEYAIPFSTTIGTRPGKSPIVIGMMVCFFVFDFFIFSNPITIETTEDAIKNKYSPTIGTNKGESEDFNLKSQRLSEEIKELRREFDEKYK